MQEIKVTLTTQKKEKPAADKLGFGNYFTDHMFVMDYYADKGWVDPRIVPFANLSLSPAAVVLHYGQEIFEGMKAYHTPAGKAVLFRPEKNMERLNLSADRLCLPKVDEAFCVEAIKKLVAIDEDWIPEGENTSLYIRPFMIGVDAHLGVHPAKHCMFIVIMSPVGSYYKEGLDPVKIFVEQEYVRAVRGGYGFTKTGGNYSASLKSQEKAEGMGYSQVLWLDGVERKYIEEVGTMNVMFKINGEVLTPSLQGSILGGITRMSCLELLRAKGYKATERRISLQEIVDAAHNGTLEETFGTGTAAVISPIGELIVGDEHIVINNGKIGETAQMLYDTITGIQNGLIPDEFGWVQEVK